jgi:hypothetical protein
MPINPTTLKALIDTQITNETVDFSITPAEVGGRMKDTIDYTTEQIALAEVLTNKSTNVATDGASNTKYPSVKSVKDYADGLVVGLLDDRGNYDASTNLFPASGGSGTAGAVMKGDLWYISVTGTLGGETASVGASVRALSDAPGQTSANWDILNVGLGFTPENVANKSTDVALGTSDTLYPTQNAVKTYVDANSGGVSYTEESRNTSSLSIAQNPASTSSKITKNFTRAFVTSGANNFLGLSNIGKDTGDYYVVQNMSTTLDLVVVPLDGTRFLQPNGFASQINFTVKANTYARFTLADNTSGSDKVFMVEVINPLGASGAGGGANFRGAWDFNGTTTYQVGDIVTSFTYSNDFQYQMWGSYICTTSNSSTTNPGISNDWTQLGLTKLAKGTRLKGVGTANEPITLKGYKRVGYIYATGTGNPIRTVNYFNGMELPTGVTESFVRVSTGTYEIRYTALDGNTFVNNLGLDNFFEFSMDLNKNISYGGTFTTTSGGNKTLVIPFTNKINDVLTDAFATVKYSMEWYE